MVSELILWCDRCFTADQQRVVATSNVLGIDGHWLEVHLCPECTSILTTEVVQFFQTHGTLTVQAAAKAERKIKAPAVADIAAAGMLPCFSCPGTYASAQALSKHLRKKHGFQNAQQAYGRECPSCGDAFEALALHSTRTHKRHISILLAEVAEQGDPLKVVQERRRLATHV